MVTSPDTYPIWRSKTPVVIVINNEGNVFQHRYRYLVITPGAKIDAYGDDNDSGAEINLTSDGLGGCVPVTEWEDPFRDETKKEGDTMSHCPLFDLPYRTLDIDISSISSPSFGKAIPSTNDLDNPTEFTEDGVRIDYWNNKHCYAFRTFIEQSKLNRRKKGGIAWSSEEDESSSMQESDHTVSLDAPVGVPTSVGQSETGRPPLPLSTNTVKKQRQIYLVCYHLPVNISRDPSTGQYSASFAESLIAKTEKAGISKSYGTKWIGTVSTPVNTIKEKDAIRKVLEPMNCIPIFFDKTTMDDFYIGMCKQVLWPAFHNIDLLDISKSGWGKKSGNFNTGNDGMDIDQSSSSAGSNWDQSTLDCWWGAFCEVNHRFANTLASMIKSNDIVWVHDYHLSLLPEMLHKAEILTTGVRTVQMVFFLHIPFPTSQVFRELEHGESILEGMLHADVVGFHAFDHARHFLNASKRILGLSYESLVGGLIGVQYRKTKVLVTISNVSIESDVVESVLSDPDVRTLSCNMKQKHLGRCIISGIDIAQGLSGISLKLLAFERLLTDYPNWQNRVVLAQICLIPGTREIDESDTLGHVRYLVRRIQNAFGPGVIDYHEVKGSYLPIKERLVLWLSSDVFMSTPIREGLNLLPLEYVFSRRQPVAPGVTITSEFSAVCSILNGALRVNPFDVKMTSTSIDIALTMRMEEREGRRERDIHFVSTSPSGMWTRNVLRDLQDVTLAAHAEDGSKSARKAQVKLQGVKSPATKLSIEMQMSSTLLDSEAVVNAYNYSDRRYFFIDFNGTLVMKEPPGKYFKRGMLGLSANKPPQETVEALVSLCSDERNFVYVVSGDTEQNIETAVGNIPGLGLAAGNGGTLANPLKYGETKRYWERFDLGIDWEAVQKVALPVMHKYTARANGSYVKLASSTIGWSYYSCDPEWGQILAAHLVIELENELSTFDVDLVTLKGVVEVVPRKLNKGLVISNVLGNQLGSQSGSDFILCMGDDISDEKMFTSVFSSIAEQQNRIQSTEGKATYAFTVAVGKKASNASYFVHKAEDVANLLIRMSGLRYTGRTMSWDVDESQPDFFA